MAVLIFCFWVVLNGRLTVEIALFGAAISAALYLFACRVLDYKPRYDLLAVKSIPWAVTYFVVLVREMVLATLSMAGWVFNHRDIPEPVIVLFHPPLERAFSHVLLANSITLTPGTITVDMHDGEFRVHCYDKSMAAGLDSSPFVRLLKKLEETL